MYRAFLQRQSWRDWYLLIRFWLNFVWTFLLVDWIFAGSVQLFTTLKKWVVKKTRRCVSVVMSLLFLNTDWHVRFFSRCLAELWLIRLFIKLLGVINKLHWLFFVEILIWTILFLYFLFVGAVDIVHKFSLGIILARIDVCQVRHRGCNVRTTCLSSSIGAL